MNADASHGLTLKLRDLVSAAPPKPGHGPLLETLGKALPEMEVKLVYSRSGWHRPGGVVDVQGNRIADSLSDWITAEADDEILDLFVTYEDAGLLATRLCGITHYFTAKTGDGPWDFIQVEVDELREITDRELFQPGNPPEDVEDLLDPADPIKVDPTPLGPGYYALRQAQDIAEAHQYMTAANYAESLLALRFVDDWLASTAGDARDLCASFVLKMTDYKDRFGERRLQATPLPTHARALPPFPSGVDRGMELSRFLTAFDRAVGYPMAWFFHLVSGAEPRLQGVAHAVYEDISATFDYLPERDAAVLKAWIDKPYMF